MKPIILTLAFLFSSHTIANTAYISIASKSSTGTFSSNSCFYTTNISDVDVNITFTLFDHNGANYTGPITYAVNISAIGEPTLLKPNQRASFCLPNTAPSYSGHGKIDAVAIDGVSRSVLATSHAMFLTYHNGIATSSSTIPINGGMPF